MPVPTWVTDQVLTASDVNTWLRPRAVYKTVDTSRSSTTTLAADPHLVIAVEATAVYRVDLHLEIQSPTTADFKCDMTGPSGFAFRLVGTTPQGSTITNFDDASTLTPSTGGLSGGLNDRMHLSGWLSTSSTAGNVTFRWAQFTSDAGSTILKFGSHIVLHRMG